jgi:catechol 2,3-dioxygenase-like lactoylglutathione lyase family enzyme
MTTRLSTQLDLPPIDQVGFVVPDMAEALTLYTPLFGPFTMMNSQIAGATFRGQNKDCHLQLAFGKSGDMEIELIAPLSGEGPHQEFIDAGGSGMHHLRYRVSDHDEKVKLAESIGFEIIWHMQMDKDIVFSYMQREGDPFILEFLQMPWFLVPDSGFRKSLCS